MILKVKSFVTETILPSWFVLVQRDISGIRYEKMLFIWSYINSKKLTLLVAKEGVILLAETENIKTCMYEPNLLYQNINICGQGKEIGKYDAPQRTIYMIKKVPKKICQLRTILVDFE